MTGFQVKSTSFFREILSYFFQDMMQDEADAIRISPSFTIGAG